MGRVTLGLAAGLLALWLQAWSFAARSSDGPAARGAMTVATGAPSARAAPADGAADADRPAAGAPVVRYQLEASLDVGAHRVTGHGRIHWRNDSRLAQRELYLHLYLNAFLNERSLFMREHTGGGFRGGQQPSRWGRLRVGRLWAPALGRELWPAASPVDPRGEDRTDWRVPLPEPVPPGGALEIEVEWVAELPSVVLRTGYYQRFHMVAQWFPKLARLEPDGRWAHFGLSRLSEFYADYSSYDVRVEVPAGFTVGATGERRGEPVASKGRRTYHYLAERVGDFAFAAYDRFDERWRRGPGGVRLRCLFPRGRERSADIELAAAARGLALFGQQYGPYPYHTLTIVHPPAGAAEAGGMEYPTLITTGGRWYWPLLGVRALEMVTLHELAHQWFYGLVGTNENRWPFLDEGLASYATADALERWWPHASAAGGFGRGLSIWAVSRARAASVWDHGIIARPASAFATGADYGGLVYSRTATLLETLARVYGRERLVAALGAYARANRFGHPGPADLIATVRRQLGVAAADNLERGLLHGGWVDFEVIEVQGEAAHPPRGLFGGGAPVAGASAGSGAAAYVGHAIVRRRGDIEVPVVVALHAADGTVQRITWDGGEASRVIAYAGSSPLVAAVVDPDTTVLIDNDLSNNARRVHGGGTPLRIVSQLLAGAEALLMVVAP